MFSKMNLIDELLPDGMSLIDPLTGKGYEAGSLANLSVEEFKELILRQVKEQETPEQRAERCFKEDEEKQNLRYLQQLEDDRQKRIAVVAKYKKELDDMITRKKKGIRYRRYFHRFVFETSQRVFKHDVEEYETIGKPDRKYWTSYDEHKKAFTKQESKIVDEIMREFGCYNY